MMVFRENENGSITHMFMGDTPHIAYERVSWFVNPSLHSKITILAFSIFLVHLIYSTIAFIERRRQKVTVDTASHFPAFYRLLIWLVTCLYIISVIQFGVIMSEPEVIAFGVPLSFKFFLAFPIILAIITTGLVIYLIWAWYISRGSLWSRIWYSLINLSSILMLLVMNYWNLLGYHF